MKWRFRLKRRSIDFEKGKRETINETLQFYLWCSAVHYIQRLVFQSPRFPVIIGFIERKHGLSCPRNGFASFEPPSSRMCRVCLIGSWVSKTHVFSVSWSTFWHQFIYGTNRRPDWHCCGIEHTGLQDCCELLLSGNWACKLLFLGDNTVLH